MPYLRTGTERRQSRSYAVRFSAGCDGVFMTLSGMSDLAQINDNLSYMKEFRPLDEKEPEAVRNVCRVLHTMKVIPCMNTKNIHHDWNADYYYHQVHTKNKGKASDCIGCGRCEKACPQHLPIRALLKDVAKEFETK